MSPLFETSPEAQSEIQRMVDPYRETSPGYRDLNREEYEYFKSVNQVDLVPTLSLLLGLPIPKNSVGKLIPELFSSYSGKHFLWKLAFCLIGESTATETFFSFWKQKKNIGSEKLRALQINGHQVAGVLKAMWSDFETESAKLLRDYQDLTEDDGAAEDDSSKRCSAGPEKQRLACWYTLALAEHASYLEMSDHGPRHGARVQYQQQSDRTRKFQAAERAYSKVKTVILTKK